ncbi:MAG: ribonuclease Z [Flavobacteriaceae bacterium]
MQITQQENTTIFSWEKTDPIGVDFRNLVKAHYKNMQDQNIVVDLSPVGKLQSSHILEFSELSVYNKEQVNKSFVVVIGTMEIKALPDDISVAPTLQEALDLIDMEEIERDLGY